MSHNTDTLDPGSNPRISLAYQHAHEESHEDDIHLHGEDMESALRNVFDTWPDELVLTDVIIHDDSVDADVVDATIASYTDTIRTDIAPAPPTDDSDTTNTAKPHRTPGAILEENASLYREKNEDYGDSWRLVGETIALWADKLGVEQVDVSDPTHAAALGLYWERLIKLVRAFNLEYNDTTANNEPTSESHADASTYAAMHAALSESVEGDDNS